MLTCSSPWRPSPSSSAMTDAASEPESDEEPTAIMMGVTVRARRSPRAMTADAREHPRRRTRRHEGRPGARERADRQRRPEREHDAGQQHAAALPCSTMSLPSTPGGAGRTPRPPRRWRRCSSEEHAAPDPAADPSAAHGRTRRTVRSASTGGIAAATRDCRRPASSATSTKKPAPRRVHSGSTTITAIAGSTPRSVDRLADRGGLHHDREHDRRSRRRRATRSRAGRAGCATPDPASRRRGRVGRARPAATARPARSPRRSR